MTADASIDASSIDASPPGPCWPIDTATPGGTVELGTGYSAYAVMPDELPMVYGVQGGYHFEVRARINGLDPGDPLEITKPANPRSLFRAWFHENNDALDGVPINTALCPNRLGYVPASDGVGHTSPNYLELRFDLEYQDAQIFNKKFRVQIEIIDSAGHYAKDEKIVIARPPAT